MLSQLHPSRLVAILSSPKDKKDDDADDDDKRLIRVANRVLTNMEPWFEVPYVTERFESSVVKRWISLYDSTIKTSYDTELLIPKPNPFVVSKKGLTLKPHPKEFKDQDNNNNNSHTKKNDDIIPVLVEHNKRRYRVWHKQDRHFLKPKAHCWFLLCCSGMIDSVERIVLTELIITLCEDRMTSVAYLADLAQLWCSIRISDDGMSLHVYGFDEKLGDLCLQLATCLATLADWNELEKRLEVAKECLRRRYRNKFLKPSRQSKYMRLRILLNRGVNSTSERIKALECCDLKRLQSHCRSLFGDKSDRVGFMEVFCMGNMLVQDSVRLARNFAEILKMCPLLEHDQKKVHDDDLLYGRHNSKCLVVPTDRVLRASSMCLNPEEGSSVSEVYFQLHPSCNFEESCMVDILSQIIDEPFYDILRTKMQLGYYVDASSRMTASVLGFCFVIKGDAVDAKESEFRIMQFLQEFYESLKKMPRNKYASHRRAVSQEKLEPDDSMGEEARRLYGEISSGRFQFRRWSREASRVMQISQKQFIEWFYLRFLKTPRRLVIQVRSSKAPKGYRGSKRYCDVKYRAADDEKNVVVVVDDTVEEEEKKEEKKVSEKEEEKLNVSELHSSFEFHADSLKIIHESRKKIGGTSST